MIMISKIYDHLNIPYEEAPHSFLIENIAQLLMIADNDYPEQTSAIHFLPLALHANGLKIEDAFKKLRCAIQSDSSSAKKMMRFTSPIMAILSPHEIIRVQCGFIFSPSTQKDESEKALFYLNHVIALMDKAPG